MHDRTFKPNSNQLAYLLMFNTRHFQHHRIDERQYIYLWKQYTASSVIILSDQNQSCVAFHQIFIAPNHATS